MVKARYKVDGMHCVGCMMAVEGALEDLPGVRSASADYARQHADIEYDENIVMPHDLIAAVAEAGYTLIIPSPD